MARMARVVLPGYPHHVTQRGNRRQQVFFSQDDFQAYLDLLGHACAKAGAEVWGYCLMPNHVHLVVVPSDEEGLCTMLGEAHRRYTRQINFREGWRGHLWQERFHSVPMDENHLLAAVRYVELNPVRAGLVEQPEQWPWSSAKAHMAGKDDNLVSVAPMLQRISDWRSYLATEDPPGLMADIRMHTRSGRPLGEERFMEVAERISARVLRPAKPGPKASCS